MPVSGPSAARSIRWSGELEPRFSETYTLSTISDDGVRLWLDGQLVLDDWTEHATTEDAVSVALVAGRVPLEASGGVNLDTIRGIAETGVDFISVGRITQSAPAVDIGLDFALEA